MVKLMGRHAGFISPGAPVASQDVNFVPVPEVPFKLEAFLYFQEEHIRHKSHAIITVAEGAGQGTCSMPASRTATPRSTRN